MTETIAKSETQTAGTKKRRALPPLTPNASLRWDVLSRILPAHCGAVLEVGCGRGAAAARIAQRASSYVAVEPDEQSFAVAQENLRGIAAIHNCTSAQLPSEDTFDTICAFDVLEHIEDDAAVLGEWRDKLNSGGQLVLSVPAWNSRMAAADILVGHFRRYDPIDIEARLRESGFVDIRVELYGFPAGHLLEAVRNFVAKRRLSDGANAMGIKDRTAGSGRLLQPSRGLSGLIVAIAARPMVWIQRLFPNRGVGLVAKASIPK